MFEELAERPRLKTFGDKKGLTSDKTKQNIMIFPAWDLLSNYETPGSIYRILKAVGRGRWGFDLNMVAMEMNTDYFSPSLNFKISSVYIGNVKHVNIFQRWKNCYGYPSDDDDKLIISFMISLILMLLVTNLANTKWRKHQKNHWNPGIWVLIWEYSVSAIQWVPTWQG